MPLVLPRSCKPQKLIRRLSHAVLTSTFAAIPHNGDTVSCRCHGGGRRWVQLSVSNKEEQLIVRRHLGSVLIGFLFASPLFSHAAAQPSAGADAKPSVVLILMDDMGYGDIGSHGVKDARTPNLDRLAREGVRLTDAYANASNCSPTRTGLISGQYQQRYGIEWPLGSAPGDSARGLPATGTSLPALLKKNGYATGLIGKWHLGFKPEFGPNAHGFDEFFGFVSGAVDYYTHRRGDGNPDLYENTTPVEVPP